MTNKTTPRKATRPAAASDAVKLLSDDHRQVHALFQKYKRLAEKHANGDERQPLAEQICLLLTVHATIEEELFYPAARAADVDTGLLDEAEVEHGTVNDLIAQIRAMGPDDERYDAKLKVLGEYVDHHVKEEQDELFPRCAKSPLDLVELGALLAARKLMLMAEMSEGMELVQ